MIPAPPLVPHRGPPAGALACARFADIDEQAAALQGWNQAYQQLSSGHFHGEIRRLQLDGVGLFMEDLQQAVHQTGWVQPQWVALGVPLVLRGDSRFCGLAGSEAALHVFSGREGFQFRSPQRHVMLGIEVDRGLFERLVVDGGPAEAEAFTAHARLHAAPAAALAHLRRLLFDLFDGAARHPDRLRGPAAQARLREDLLEALAAALAPSPDAPAGARAAPAQATQLAERARAWVCQRLDDPPTVAELCQALGVSRRTLQNSFQATWGMGPLAWLNILRLNAVRRHLKTAASVTDAATQFGFWHFGHFAEDYRRLFGERPSETLRRVRQGSGGVGSLADH